MTKIPFGAKAMLNIVICLFYSYILLLTVIFCTGFANATTQNDTVSGLVFVVGVVASIWAIVKNNKFIFIHDSK